MDIANEVVEVKGNQIKISEKLWSEWFDKDVF